ncbi:glycosyltransferase family 1 protein [Cellulomonas fimi]|uniref:Glycosyltransferase family 4 protein n=1 Tax=Cellulomonas fimi TaxID=1708 RepID=A0A7Y0QH87_CELFI|nr:glycosyltransferase family 1 protein [Cellulomonas fimi]NMR20881.1 glycosyltransferase family 4 protein [Cellulomonas fimi]
MSGTDRDVRVAVSMLTLVPGGMGGSETYARELTRELARVPSIDARAYVGRVAAGFSAGIPEVVVPEVDGGPSTRERVQTLLGAARHRHAILGRMGGADVMHVPFTAPVPWPPAGLPLVQSLLDVQHLDLPQLFGRAERLYRRRYYDHAARRAQAVVTISEFAKERIVAQLQLDPATITVAHLGVDATAFTPHLGERERFLFYPARGWPHKNHARLIQAVDLLRRDDPGLRLVLTGGGLDTLGEFPDWVDVRGLVPLAELRELYRTAACLVFPSLYEGFGLPPLEAMASGCPVAASGAGSLPEICGDAAVLFDATDPEAIAAGVRAALADAAGLQQRGLAQVTRFTWEGCAAAHVTAYRAAAHR